MTQQWATDVLPEFDTSPRWIVGKTTHDTAKFAAVMAMAARVYAKAFPVKAKRYFHLAEFAWKPLRNRLGILELAVYEEPEKPPPIGVRHLFELRCEAGRPEPRELSERSCAKGG